MQLPRACGREIRGNKIRNSGKNGNTARPAIRLQPASGKHSGNISGKTGKVGNAARKALFLSSSVIASNPYRAGNNSGNISGKNSGNKIGKASGNHVCRTTSFLRGTGVECQALTARLARVKNEKIRNSQRQNATARNIGNKTSNISGNVHAVTKRHLRPLSVSQGL